MYVIHARANATKRKAAHSTCVHAQAFLLAVRNSTSVCVHILMDTRQHVHATKLVCKHTYSTHALCMMYVYDVCV